MIIVEKTIESSFDAVHCFVLHVLRVFNNLRIDKLEEISFKVNVVLREILNNSVEHGNKFDESKKIYCKIEVFNDNLLITVKDEGPGFSEKSIEISDKDPLKRRRRGYDIIKKYDFIYKIDDEAIKLKYKF